MIALAPQRKVIQAASPKRGCLMLMLPSLDSTLPNWAGDHIRESDLHPEGVETEPHITVLYGFKAAFDASRLVNLLQETKPPLVTLGKVSRFECEEYDVLKVDVKSPDLVKLNSKLAERFAGDIVPSEYDYHPHLTIAYVKKGTCRELDGSTDFENYEPGGVQMLYSLPEKKGRKVFDIGTKQVTSCEVDATFLLRALDEELVTRAAMIQAVGEPEVQTKSSEKPRFFTRKELLDYQPKKDTSTSVKAMLHDASGHVLLLKDVRTGNWDLPGGHKHIGESDYDALVREVKEETGLEIVDAKFTKQNPKAIFFDATVAGVEPNVTLSEEHTAFKWEQPGRAKHDTAFWTGGFANHDAIRDEAQATITKAVNRVITLAEANVLGGRDDEQFAEDAALVFAAALALAYATAAKKMGTEARGADHGDVTTKAEEAEYVEGRLKDLKEFPRNTTKRLKAEMERGKAAGEDERELTHRVHVEGDAVREGAGKQVASTEAQAIYGHSAERAFSRAGYTSVYWVTEGDDRVRDSHLECEKAGAVKLGRKFPNGLRFPGDTENGGPEECANCRCHLEGASKR